VRSVFNIEWFFIIIIHASSRHDGTVRKVSSNVYAFGLILSEARLFKFESKDVMSVRFHSKRAVRLAVLTGGVKCIRNSNYKRA
jgi:hypothetical protein